MTQLTTNAPIARPTFRFPALRRPRFDILGVFRIPRVLPERHWDA